MKLSIVVVAFLSMAQSWAQAAGPADVSTSPTSAPGAAPTGVSITNVALNELSESLLGLQTNIQQTLSILTAFNAGVAIMNLPATGPAASAAAAPSGNFSANLGVNLANNFAVNSTVPPGASLINAIAAAKARAASRGITEGVAAFPLNRDTLRSLRILQSDIQRMLPVLNALNRGATNSPGSPP